MTPTVIRERHGDKIVYEWDGFYLRDDLEIRQGDPWFKGWEQAYSLFMRDTDGCYHREGVYAADNEKSLEEQFDWVLSKAETKIKELRNENQSQGLETS